MKMHISFIIATTCALIAIFVSCTREDNYYEAVAKNSCTFIATIEEEDAKAYLGEEGIVYWNRAEMISVFSNTDREPKEYSKDNDDNVFSGPSLEGDNFFAFYPTEGKQSTENPMLLQFPAQNIVFGSNANAIPMIATSTGHNLKFRQTCGIIHIHITGEGEYNAISFRGCGAEKISGASVVDLAMAQPVMKLKEGASDVMVAPLPENTDFSKGLDAYVPLPPMCFENGFTVELLNIDPATQNLIGYIFKTSRKETVLNRAEMLSYDFNLDDDDDPDPAKIRYYFPQNSLRVDPDCYSFKLDTLGIWGTINGKPLQIMFYSNQKWISVYQKEGHICAGINGNTNNFSRTGSVVAAFFLGDIPLFKKFLRIVQNHAYYIIEVKNNIEDFPDWVSAYQETIGKDYLFFTPYECTDSINIRTNFPCFGDNPNDNQGIYIPHYPIYEENVSPDEQELAIDDEAPLMEWERTDKGGKGFPYNYKIHITNSANRNYVEREISYDLEDKYMKGLTRMGILRVFPIIRVCTDWINESFQLSYVWESNDKIVHDDLHLVQFPVVMESVNDLYRITWPIASESSPHPGYSPVCTAVDNWDEDMTVTSTDYYLGEAFSSNMDWDYCDILFDSSNLEIVATDKKLSGKFQNGRVNYIRSFDMYCRENSQATCLERIDKNSYKAKDVVPERSVKMYIKIDFKDGGAPVYWYVADISQMGVPALKFKGFTWSGVWETGIFTLEDPETHQIKTYTKRTTGYFDVGLGNCWTGSTPYEFATLGYGNFKYWRKMIIQYPSGLNLSLLSHDENFSDKIDARIHYHNGVKVYASNGEYSYSTTSSNIVNTSINAPHNEPSAAGQLSPEFKRKDGAPVFTPQRLTHVPDIESPTEALSVNSGAFLKKRLKH